MKIKEKNIWLAKEVLDKIANTQNNKGVQDIFSYGECKYGDFVRVSPLLIETLIKYFHNKSDFNTIHTTTLDGLYYNTEGVLRKFIDVDNMQQESDNYWFQNFSKSYLNEDDHNVDLNAFSAKGILTCEQPAYHLHILSDLLLAWILIGNDNVKRKEFTRLYLGEIKGKCTTSNNIGIIGDLNNAMNSLKTRRKELDEFLESSSYSPYKSTNELAAEFRDHLNSFKFGKTLDPLLRSITPLHVCAFQAVGSLCIGILSGHNKLSLAALTIMNAMGCGIIYRISQNTENFTKFHQDGKEKDLPSFFQISTILSVINLGNTLTLGYHKTSCFNLAITAVSALKIFHSQGPEILHFGLQEKNTGGQDR
jgi:hypothetical protein